MIFFCSAKNCQYFFLFVDENLCCEHSFQALIEVLPMNTNNMGFHRQIRIKVLTALVGRLSLSVDWENGLAWRRKTISFDP